MTSLWTELWDWQQLLQIFLVLLGGFFFKSKSYIFKEWKWSQAGFISNGQILDKHGMSRTMDLFCQRILVPDGNYMGFQPNSEMLLPISRPQQLEPHFQPWGFVLHRSRIGLFSQKGRGKLREKILPLREGSGLGHLSAMWGTSALHEQKKNTLFRFSLLFIVKIERLPSFDDGERFQIYLYLLDMQTPECCQLNMDTLLLHILFVSSKDETRLTKYSSLCPELLKLFQAQFILWFII